MPRELVLFLVSGKGDSVACLVPASVVQLTFVWLCVGTLLEEPEGPMELRTTYAVSSPSASASFALSSASASPSAVALPASSLLAELESPLIWVKEGRLVSRRREARCQEGCDVSICAAVLPRSADAVEMGP